MPTSFPPSGDRNQGSGTGGPRTPLGGPSLFGDQNAFRRKLEALRAKWGRFVAAGALMVLFGVVALGNLLAATVAVVFMTGIMLLIGGAVQIAQSFGARGWGKVLYWFASGLIYAIAGVIALARPMVAADVFTLMFGITVIIVGGFRIIAALDAKGAAGWLWVLAGGIVTTLFGLLITAQWPQNTDWLIGLVLAVDLLSQGFTWIFFGLAIRKR